MPHRVLCIEGNEATRARVKSLLEARGFAVDTSDSGLDGLSRALARPPDLVIADVHLPDIEGYEVAARLKRDGALARVPFLAVGDSREDHDLALAAGADGFVERALDDERLGEEVSACLAGKREVLPEDGERQGLRTLSGSMAARLETALVAERRSSERIAELDRLRSAFMHNLSHELSTPLTPLAGYLKLLQAGRLGPLSPQQQRVLDAMLQSVGRLVRVVDNLADFASLRSGQGAILEGEVHPDRLAEDVVAELRDAIREARLHVSVLPAGGGPIVADPRKLRQAVANLVQNAVKFSPHGGEVLVEVTRDPTRLRFSVYDQGPGVRAGEVELIFEPLHHAASKGREDARAPGTGLGLPVARGVAEAHGGRAWVESPPRTQPARLSRQFTGSKFVLEIPVRPADRPGAVAGSTPASAG
ncbi:MAG TPA: hybrid sensor histidine kinase/response regulator [Anaeromyxobacter sp.]|nr:hybrid sensor histidine kinase/response regulator [Anaeromyxobacter sp.]